MSIISDGGVLVVEDGAQEEVVCELQPLEECDGTAVVEAEFPSQQPLQEVGME